MYSHIIQYIKSLYKQDFVPLHEPRFIGNEKKYVLETIDSTFVSSVGKFVTQFEEITADYTGAKYAVATVNGTAALHIALLIAGVKSGDEVLTQALTFVATANAIAYCAAKPTFIDVDSTTLGLSPEMLKNFLLENVEMRSCGFTYNKISGNRVSACVPMHTFGFPTKIDEIVAVCKEYNIAVVEDAAESLGSFYKNKHTGTFADIGILSFNGNKTVTTGGGGMLLTSNKEVATFAKHITTTAKMPHKWEYIHDYTAYNYRLPNINAALGVAQMENLNFFIEKKRILAEKYKNFFQNIENVTYIEEPIHSRSNFWFNTIMFQTKKERDEFLEVTNQNGVMTRPAWQLMHKLPMYQNCFANNLKTTEFLADRMVNIPSSVIIEL